MLRKLGRLFVIKTRWEAWFVIYAIAVGAIERGRHYLEVYPGWAGWMLAFACTGVVFLAGGKLLDAVRPISTGVQSGPYGAVTQRRTPTRHATPPLRRHRPAESRYSRRSD